MSESFSSMSVSEHNANISDDALLKLGVKELNKLLKSVTAEERSKLKKRRRILKNRGYAANCRTKRMSYKEILEMEKNELEIDVKKMKHDNDVLKIKLDSIKERYKDLEHYVNILGNRNNSA
jgi:transcription factor MAFF/G/K